MSPSLSGAEHLVGLEELVVIEALREQRISLAFLDQLGTIIDGLEDADPEYTPDYITNVIPVELKKTRNLTDKDFTPGRIHTTNCSGGGKISLHTPSLLALRLKEWRCRSMTFWKLWALIWPWAWKATS